MTDLLDIAEGRRLRDEGKAKAAEGNRDALDIAQSIARGLGRHQETVSIDDVKAAMSGMGIDPGILGNSAGSVFSGKQWERVGYKQSERVKARGRVISVWRMAGKAGAS